VDTERVLIHDLFRAGRVLCGNGLDHHPGGLLDADRGVDPDLVLGLSSLLDGAVIRPVLCCLNRIPRFTITFTTSVLAVDWAPILCYTINNKQACYVGFA